MVNDGVNIKLDKLTDLTELDEDYIKHFSGTGTYTNNFNLTEKPINKKIMLDLGKVCEMAKVRINGIYVGGAWTTPYVIDITKAVNTGNNTIEISVVNNWVNRLVGDSRLSDEERKTSYVAKTYNPKTKLQSSGLIGPVIITSE